MTEAQQYMRRALELAALGQGQTGTNPMVGAVLVHEGRIIGEGYHHGYGQPHAEVMAVRSVTEPKLLGEATLYVTLEPCAHYGKTPPCAELICTVGIPHVVVATLDPFPEVAGRGIERLRRAGIEVTLGVLETEAWALNAPFFTAHTLHRPFVTLKWAQSLDAFMDSPRQDRSIAPVTFSSPLQQRSVHRARMEHEAILVGYRTALLDDPQLSNRLWYGRSPLRVVLDPQLQLPPELRLFADAGAPTLIVHLEAARSRRREGLAAAAPTAPLRSLRHPVAAGGGWGSDPAALRRQRALRRPLYRGLGAAPRGGRPSTPSASLVSLLPQLPIYLYYYDPKSGYRAPRGAHRTQRDR